LDRYFAQVAQLQHALRGALRLILVEGDSTDDTWAQLHRRCDGLDAVIVKREHGGPAYGSVDLPARWKQLAYCCNGVLDAVRDMTDVSALIYVESDLVWRPETMLRLLSVAGTSGAAAPMCFTAPQGLDGPRGTFYDIWGHMKDGVNFSPHPPYHPALTNGQRLVAIDSAGSCVVASGGIVRDPRVRFDEADCIRGYCRSIRALGVTLWLDTTCEVRHP
jgi:hypothetical protein